MLQALDAFDAALDTLVGRMRHKLGLEKNRAKPEPNSQPIGYRAHRLDAELGEVKAALELWRAQPTAESLAGLLDEIADLANEGMLLYRKADWHTRAVVAGPAVTRAEAREAVRHG